ncbi:MAG: hypothetical protein ACTSYY_07435 [Promethearchaeota archaeon]
MFNPQQFNQLYSEWTDPANIAQLGRDDDGNEIWEYWLYPGNPSQDPLPEMSYFPKEFLEQMLHGTFSINNHRQNYLVDIFTVLDNIWKKWHPE